MGNSIWKGHIAFGLVAFPVKLHAAARSHQGDHSRVKQVLYCQAEDQPVARHELVQGYEYEKDRYVVVEERELAQLAPRSCRVMEVLEFVPEAEVDPVYLDASYYVAPERAGEKPYTLLYQTPPPALSPSAFTSFMRAIMRASSRSSTARPRTAPSPVPSWSKASSMNRTATSSSKIASRTALR